MKYFLMYKINLKISSEVGLYLKLLTSINQIYNIQKNKTSTNLCLSRKQRHNDLFCPSSEADFLIPWLAYLHFIFPSCYILKHNGVNRVMGITEEGMWCGEYWVLCTTTESLTISSETNDANMVENWTW